MSEKADKTGWHYGFYAAMKVIYTMLEADVSYRQEHQLGKEPVRLDFLIIKNNSQQPLHDQIGSFFSGYNIFEYKSPNDSLTFDDFCKAQGYGLFYKVTDRTPEEIPLSSITVTLVRHTYPEKFFKRIEENEYGCSARFPGIYELKGNMFFRTQIIVTSELPHGIYDGLKLLSRNDVTKEDVRRYMDKACESGSNVIRDNAGTVLDVCLSANLDLSKVIKEDKIMSEQLMEIMGIDKRLADERAEGRKEGREEGKEELIAAMLGNNTPVSTIADMCGMSANKIKKIARKYGLADGM